MKKNKTSEFEQLEIDLKKATIKETEQQILSQRFKDRYESKKGIVEKLQVLKAILSDSSVESDPNKPLSEAIVFKKIIESEKNRKIIEDKIMDLIKKL